jgi:hypothetical protein
MASIPLDGTFLVVYSDDYVTNLPIVLSFEVKALLHQVEPF